MAMTVRRHSISFLLYRRLSTDAAFATPRRRSPRKLSVSNKTMSLLKSTLRRKSDPEKVIELFESSPLLPRLYANCFIYEISVDRLAHFHHRPDLVERLLESQLSDPAAPKSESFYNRIMSLYANASMPDHVLRTFEQIPSPSERSVCALLTAYLKNHQYDRVRVLFDRIPVQYGIVPSVTTHNILLAAMCNAGEVLAARKMLDEMLDKKGLKPCITSYNIILSAYLKNEDVAGFEDILQEISRKELAHNIVTYNLRISIFCNNKESPKAEKLLDELVLKEIKPSYATFNTIIKGFCQEGDPDSALRLFNRMKQMKSPKGGEFSPSADVYIALLRALVGKGDFTSSLPICKELLKTGSPPPFEVFKALVDELVKNSKPHEVKLLFDKMRKNFTGCPSSPWKEFEAQLSL